MPDPAKDWIEAALKVTGYFEDSADPWGGVSGNFDGMGVSLGVLQWNLGSNSLQPLVKAAGQAAVTSAMPTIGADFWAACNAPGTGWKTYSATWHTSDNKLKPTPKAELKTYARSRPFIDQQVIAANTVAGTAFRAAENWAFNDDNWVQVTKKLFCWFFDVTTQNGGLKGITPADVKLFAAKPDANKIVCDWLAAQNATVAGAGDAAKNANLWRTAMPKPTENLFLLSYLRSLKAKQAWQIDTMNRKGTIAVGEGWVHKSLCKVAPITGTD